MGRYPKPSCLVGLPTLVSFVFCELGWYEWVKFLSTTVLFPEDLLVLGKYLGLSIDIGPTMTANILTPTGKVVHCSTY